MDIKSFTYHSENEDVFHATDGEFWQRIRTIRPPGRMLIKLGTHRFTAHEVEFTRTTSNNITGHSTHLHHRFTQFRP